MEIIKLFDISILKNLNRLDLNNNSIVNIEALSMLNNIVTLNLRSNKIMDITPIISFLNRNIEIKLEYKNVFYCLFVGDNPFIYPPKKYCFSWIQSSFSIF